MEMPWPQAREFVQVVQRQRLEALRDASLAARAGQADEKGWKAWMAALDD